MNAGLAPGRLDVGDRRRGRRPRRPAPTLLGPKRAFGDRAAGDEPHLHRRAGVDEFDRERGALALRAAQFERGAVEPRLVAQDVAGISSGADRRLVTTDAADVHPDVLSSSVRRFEGRLDLRFNFAFFRESAHLLLREDERPVVLHLEDAPVGGDQFDRGDAPAEGAKEPFRQTGGFGVVPSGTAECDSHLMAHRRILLVCEAFPANMIPYFGASHALREALWVDEASAAPCGAQVADGGVGA